MTDKNFKTQEKVVFNKEQLDKVEELAGFLTTEQIAAYFGICRATFTVIRQRQPEVASRYEKGKALKISNVVRNIYDKAMGFTDKGDNTCMLFFAKTIGRLSEARDEVVAENTITVETEEEKQARLQEIKRYTAFKKYEAEFADFLKSKE